MNTPLGELLTLAIGIAGVVFIVFMKWRDSSVESDRDDPEQPPDLPLWR